MPTERQKEPWEDVSDGTGGNRIPIPALKLAFGLICIVCITTFVGHDKNLYSLSTGVGVSIFVFFLERFIIKQTKDFAFFNSDNFLNSLPVIVMAIAVIVAIITFLITWNPVMAFGSLIFPTLLTLLNWMASA